MISRKHGPVDIIAHFRYLQVPLLFVMLVRLEPESAVMVQEAFLRGLKCRTIHAVRARQHPICTAPNRDRD
ncbi:hypothetical protein ANCCAN_04468 [Ancylostoma caninum]|uniref:Uncharacterized protein n=1 Tax=Ancylostoma caninum TaxID=29170 RepID=A0A368H2P4_ANCCA|nr:hypothetical protein ANCCAN_04468 [Ancylostoma caninum]